MHVIGTTGHVDHGKSTLVRALTGIDPDRLKEEKKRQMTIDLGFAWYESPGARSIGIVDVPGHRDFIENMLAGVGGIDAVLLVIAADEGIMPQTLEHLAIINRLHIPAGLVVLTKIDLVDDPAWLDLVEMEVRDTIKGSMLENAPVLRVSAISGEGVEELKESIDSLLINLGPHLDIGRARLPVDRVFSLTGFGTVVTGTLIGGTFRVGELVEILPSMKTGRIRGLESHKKQKSVALPGSRTAMNLSGIDLSEVKRGDVVAHPGMFSPTHRIDAMIEIIPDAPTGIRHNDRIKLFIATSESTARIRLLQKQILLPGESGWVQIEFEKEIIADKDDRFILRRMSPAQTIGGGLVVDAHPPKRYKLQDEQIIERLEAIVSPVKLDTLYALVGDHPFITEGETLSNISMESNLVSRDLETLVEQGRIIKIAPEENEPAVYLDAHYWQKLTGKMQEILLGFHQQNPLHPGIRREELARRLKLSASAFDHCLAQWKNDHLVNENAGVISLASFDIKYSPAQSRMVKQVFSLIDHDPFNPPGVKEVRTILSDDLYKSLLEQGVLVQLSPEVLVREEEYRIMLEYVRSECGKGVLLTLAQFRDHFSNSRKYSQAFLEHLDREGITIREGDGRKLRK